MELADKDSFYNNNVIKYSYHLSDTSKNSTKDKKTNNKPKFKGKKLKINSVSELEFLYNDSQNRATSKNKNMKIKKKNLINYTSNDKNSTSIMSPKNDSFNKNSRQYQQFNLKKSSQSSIDIFWESVKQYEQYKNDKINNLKTEIMNQELSEIRKIPKILKRSIIIVNAKGRDPLYLQRPLSEEKMLEKDFLKFYKRNLKFTNKVHSKLINEKRLQEKYSKIYEDNIQWKKNKEEKNNKTRYEYNKMFENDINKVPKKAITMGIKNILDAETIILMANGTDKAEAIKNVMGNRVDVNIHVTALQMHKGKVYVIVDKKAASKL
jgi:hypothetical protein